MIQNPTRPITADEIATYREEGIVLLRGLFDQCWVNRLNALIEADMTDPKGMPLELAKDGDPGRFFANTFMWHKNPGFREVVFLSPAAEIAAACMGSETAHILFDQLLVKEPETREKTVWHHDQTYWPVDGRQVATLWLALDPVTTETGAVEYVVGSHLWGERYHPVAFVDHGKYQTDLPKVPDIDARRGDFTIRQFDMAPGDCTLHHGLTVHGAPGNSRPDRRRRAYITRWAGDDAVYDPRPGIQPMLFDPALQPGDPVDSDLWPKVWPRG